MFKKSTCDPFLVVVKNRKQSRQLPRECNVALFEPRRDEMNHIGAFTRNWRRRSEMCTIMAVMAGSRRCSASPVSLEGERNGALFRSGSG